MRDIVIRTSAILFLLTILTQTLYARAPESVVPAQLDTYQMNAGGANQAVIAPVVQASLDDATSQQDMHAVIVTLREQANLRALQGLDRATRNRRIVTVLQALSNASQAPLRAYLENKRREGLVADYTPYWVFNGLAVTATGAVIEEIASREEVLRITADETISGPQSSSGTIVEPNLAQINAPALWDLGFRGAGIVVASMDWGVYGDHPDLSTQWRGGNNSWYDPYGEHVDGPYDDNGHGTQTMGIMVGRDAGGSAIGVAPDAQWIAVKIFNDQGDATTSAIHSGFQWLLDPDDNPNTADAPHVVNNSWGYTTTGCNIEFQLDLQALRAMGIVPVFAAGNAGPNPLTSRSPANNPEALAVGGVDGSDQIYLDSSRGPSACDGDAAFPDLVAPAVQIWSSNQYGSYASDTGTSLAAPHVSGALALLLSAFGDLTADQQESALSSTALDLGPEGLDDDFGYGRLDVLAAFNTLQEIKPTVTPHATPTANPLYTPTPTPTMTATPAPPTATPTPTMTPQLVNVALNKSVTVSSVADGSHGGAMAVDGDLQTFWQTAKAVGRNVPSSEWIVVDLGSSWSISRVELQWDTYYATSYSIQTSDDGSNWTTVFNTSGADGGDDTMNLDWLTVRFVRMESTSWSDSRWRSWLREFEIYSAGSGTEPTPTATPSPVPTATDTVVPTATQMPDPTATDTPGPTATDTPGPTVTPNSTPSPTPTSTAGGSGTVHVGDLDGVATLENRNRWNAAVTITVHDQNEAPLSNALVSALWNGGTDGDGSCLTDGMGQCSLTLGRIRTSQTSVSLTISSVAWGSSLYEAADNHDADGSSDGTTITLQAPDGS